MTQLLFFCFSEFCVSDLGEKQFHKAVSPFIQNVLRKPAFCICKNKDTDQLLSNRSADQRLCFCYIDCTIPLLPKYEIPSL